MSKVSEMNSSACKHYLLLNLVKFTHTTYNTGVFVGKVRMNGFL